jgi:hypothetical protein
LVANLRASPVLRLLRFPPKLQGKKHDFVLSAIVLDGNSKSRTAMARRQQDILDRVINGLSIRSVLLHPTTMFVLATAIMIGG